MTLKKFLEKGGNYLMLSTFLAMFLVLASLMSILLCGEQILASQGWWIFFWVGLHLLVIGIALYLLGGRLYKSLFLPPADVRLPEFAGRFAGMLRGLLFGGALIIVASAALFIVKPELMFVPEFFKGCGLIAGVTLFLGAIFYPDKVARRMRLWLLIALIGQFFLFQMVNFLVRVVRQIRFEYKLETLGDGRQMLLVDPTTRRKCFPEGASKVEIKGVRGLVPSFSWKCTVQQKEFEAFANLNKYEFKPLDTNKVYCIHNGFKMIYDSKSSLLQGVFEIPQQ